MVWPNLLSVALAVGYFCLTLRLYLLPLDLKRSRIVGSLFILALCARWIFSNEYTLVQFLLMNGILYHFCASSKKEKLFWLNVTAMLILLAVFIAILFFATNFFTPFQSLPNPFLGFHFWNESIRANVNRMIFDFPYAHIAEEPASKGTGNGAFANSGIFLLAVLCVIPWIKHHNKIPIELKIFVGFTWFGIIGRCFFYAGMESMMNFMPGFLLMIFFTSQKLLPIRIRREVNSQIG